MIRLNNKAVTQELWSLENISIKGDREININLSHYPYQLIQDLLFLFIQDFKYWVVD